MSGSSSEQLAGPSDMDDKVIAALHWWHNSRECGFEPRRALVELMATESERDWLAQALQDQETAYAALEQQYLALTEQHAALVDRLGQTAAILRGEG